MVKFILRKFTGNERDFSPKWIKDFQDIKKKVFLGWRKQDKSFSGVFDCVNSQMLVVKCLVCELKPPVSKVLTFFQVPR